MVTFKKYTIEEFLVRGDLNVSKRCKEALSGLSKEEVMSLLEDPNMNPLRFYFDPDYLNKKKYPHLESTSTIVQFMEVLIECGHIDWICNEIPKRKSGVSVLAALSGHKKLIDASSRFFNMPSLEKCINILSKKRNSLEDILYLSTQAIQNEKFKIALAESISRYCLTCDVSNSLMDPVRWFKGFDRANPGKLSYFFALCPESYPILNDFWLFWTNQLPLPWKNFCHPQGHMLYTKCYHYRTAVVGEAKRSTSNPLSLDKVRILLRNMPRVIKYYQNGECEGFIDDTTKMAIKLLS